MKIGIIGAGNVGIGIGRRLASKGHEVVVSFARTQDRVEAAAIAIGSGARAGSVEDAARYGEVVIVATPWVATLDAIRPVAASLARRIVWDTTNPLKPDMSGLTIGTTTSGGETLAASLPGGRVVKAIPPFAELLQSSSTRIDGRMPSVFVCGDDATARARVLTLVADIDAIGVDAGPLSNARFTEPAGMLLIQLAYAQGMGPRIGTALLA